MTKLLLWVVIIVVALLALRLVSIASAKRRNDPTGSGASPKGVRPDNMVRCVRCGVYLPSADAKSGPEGLTCGEPACVERR